MPPATSSFRKRRADPWMALDEEKFDLWQPNLLALLNDPKLKRFVRWRLYLNAHVGRDTEILSYSPHRFAVPLKGEQVKSTFMSQPAIQRNLYRAFQPVFWGMHAYDWALDRTSQRWVQSLIRPMRPAFGLSSLTANSQAGGGGSNVTCDGIARYDPQNYFQDVFSVLNTASSSTTASTTETLPAVLLKAGPTTGKFCTLYRVFSSFDTSSIGSSGTISGATMSLMASYHGNDLGSTPLHVAASTQANANDLVVGDYSAKGSTSFGSIAYASWVQDSWADIALNASGLAAISKTGVTKFVFLLEWDLNGSFTGTWAANAQNAYYFPSSDWGGGNIPKLVVTYTTATQYTQSLTAATVALAGAVAKKESRALSASVASFAAAMPKQARKILTGG